MNSLVSSAAAADCLARLPALRARYCSETSSAEDKFEACAKLARLYFSLGLFDRVGEWLRAAGHSLGGGEHSQAVLYEFHMVSASLALAQQDLDACRQSLERLKTVTPVHLDQEREFLQLQIQYSLLGESPEPFATLEKAFRHLRHNPSALWSSRYLRWKAQWQLRSGREEDGIASLKKALGDAQRAQDQEAELLCWLELGFSAPSKTKAVRAARTALEKALEWNFPSAVAEAYRTLSRATAGTKESESATAFMAYFEAGQQLSRQTALWEREARDADTVVFDSEGQDRRRLEAEMLSVITSRIAGDADLSRCLDGIYLPLKTLMAADVFGIALLSPDGTALDYALFIEEGRRTRVGLIPVDSSRSLGAWCFRERQAIRVNDIDAEFGRYLKELSRLSEHRPKSMLFQPLMTEKGSLGIITVQAFGKGAYGPESAAHLAVVAACVALRLQTGVRSD